MDFGEIFLYIRRLYGVADGEVVPLHEPRFLGNEKKYLAECIDSGFVSSVGEFVGQFEREIAKFCGVGYAIATTNGTAALHASLYVLGVNEDCEVITQPLSFIATSNAIAYTGASPVYVDVDLDTLSLSPTALKSFLEQNVAIEKGKAINKHTKKIVKACVPMHTFGHPARIAEIVKICLEWNILVVEDAAESLGSYVLVNGEWQHTGSFGVCGILSFNGNKTITCGGGGIILTQNEELAKKLKHITTTAKVPHSYEYHHDMLGFNYRLPNLNAALAVAQLEWLPHFLANKRETARIYANFFRQNQVEFIQARSGTNPNFWLNAILCKDKQERDAFLQASSEWRVAIRPAWELNSLSPMYAHCQSDELKNAKFLSERIVNIPSSVRVKYEN